ncbi:hypothetical protein U1Q18_026936, partial [Sarracenia purpurea var. burkii]
RTTDLAEKAIDCEGFPKVAKALRSVRIDSSSGFSPLAVDLRRIWPKAEVCSLPEASKRISVLEEFW